MKVKYRLYTYDLWTDPEGSRSVNDVYPHGIVTLNVRKGDHPSDYQLNHTLGVRAATWDGDADHVLYASDRNGDPLCELRRVA